MYNDVIYITRDTFANACSGMFLRRLEIFWCPVARFSSNCFSSQISVIPARAKMINGSVNLSSCSKLAVHVSCSSPHDLLQSFSLSMIGHGPSQLQSFAHIAESLLAPWMALTTIPDRTRPQILSIQKCWLYNSMTCSLVNINATVSSTCFDSGGRFWMLPLHIDMACPQVHSRSGDIFLRCHIRLLQRTG